MNFFDITPIISPRLAVFPGDVSFSREISLDFKKGHHLLLSAIKSTLHLGAHADAANHYHAKGEGIEKRNLERYFGLCQVLRVKIPRGERIQPKHISSVSIRAPRVLFHTGSFPSPEHWNSDFCSLSPELIDFLAVQKVQMIGIDTPSVDPETSKDLESHQALYRNKIAVLEGVVLEKVPEGIYFLSALPLPIEEADASPVRAILVPIQEMQSILKIESAF